MWTTGHEFVVTADRPRLSGYKCRQQATVCAAPVFHLFMEAVYHYTKLQYKCKGEVCLHNYVQVSVPCVREYKVDKLCAVLIPKPEAYHIAAMIYSCRFLFGYNISSKIETSFLLLCFIARNGLRLFTMEKFRQALLINS